MVACSVGTVVGISGSWLPLAASLGSQNAPCMLECDARA